MSFTQNIGFIGLGTMGFHMAGHIANKYAQLNVYNRDIEKTKKWMQHFNDQNQNAHIRAYDHLVEFAKNTHIIVLCIGNDDSVRETLHTIVPHIKKHKDVSSVVIDHTTTSAQLAKGMHQLCLDHGIHFLDCPVSGGEIGAKNATLTAMCGGDESVFHAIQHVIAMYSKCQSYMGESGKGQITKMVNQILIANILQGLAEGLTLAKKAQLNIPDMINTLKLGAAGSWQLENRGNTMVNHEFNFGFAIDLMLKDLNIVQDFCAAHAIPILIPQTMHIKSIYETLSRHGYGKLDTSALIKQFED